MDRRSVGFALLAAGGVLVVAGGVGMISGGGSSTASAGGGTPPTGVVVTPTATIQAPDTTVPVVTTTTAVTATTAAPSTSISTTTTTVAETTTTTVPRETLEQFASLFSAALANGDGDFVFDRLHPVVIDRFGAELCRAYVDREVLLISDYRLSGEASTSSASFTISTGDIEVETLNVPVSFSFQGQEVETDGLFGFVEDAIHWFTTCR